ncbi:hypothetical protein EYF80_043982 [Liparis tanakae]|uniref:Uncharacterized protein n=1 Tax=Liparis tanakae TaxID=230148 RepID=A0A4Z2FX61_9TELE|nr:hypothetical protein EYF80_043982 [Liparis tanakae]
MWTRAFVFLNAYDKSRVLKAKKRVLSQERPDHSDRYFASVASRHDGKSTNAPTRNIGAISRNERDRR